MHKKLEADLISLAHSILQMKNREDVFALKAKAHQVYEKLSLLAYVEEYINNTPNATSTKEAILTKIAAIENNVVEVTKEVVVSEAVVNEVVVEEVVIKEEEVPVINNEEEATPIVKQPTTLSEFLIENKDKEEIPFDVKEVLEEEPVISEKEVSATHNEVMEQPFDALESILFEEPVVKEEILSTEEEVTNVVEEKEEQVEIVLEEETIPVEEKTAPPTEEVIKKLTLEEELGDTLSVDVMANLFEKAPVKRTLNDRLLQGSIKIDLNDRIAFVKNLFEGNQEDFNRVVSQLNTIKTEKEAKHFILKMIKPDYDWSSKEVYETRLLEIIERRFS